MSVAPGNSTVGMPGTEAPRHWLKTVVFYAVIVAINLLLCEVLLRVADFRDLRVYPEATLMPLGHDSELGWYPIANAVKPDGVRINSLGLRDVELEPAGKPTIAFVGDSFVYGIGVKAEERFTDLLRHELVDFRIVNAGVPGYGTDQELLMLKRLWPKLTPRVVVLIVCVDNDHDDNSKSSRHGRTFKPYLAKVGDQWRFEGLPAPRSHRWYYEHNWFAGHIALVRLGFKVVMLLRHPQVVVPDPTNQLVAMMRNYVEFNGARFFVGLQKADPTLEPFLDANRIPYLLFDGAPTIANDNHWNPEGHRIVARRLKDFLADRNVLAALKP